MKKDFIGMLRESEAAFDSAKVEVQGGVSAADYQDIDIQLSVAGVVQEWAQTSDLDADETMADRLNSLLAGVADESGDNNGDLSDDELELYNIACEVAVDTLVSLGASEEDALAIINDNDADAADRVAELVKEAAGDSDDFVNDFVFGGDSDDAVFDAVYKKKIKVIGGKKVVKRVKISGFTKRSSKQKAAMKKAQLKAHSGMAKIKRMRSMKKRASLGVK